MVVDGARIAAVTPADGPEAVGGSDEWLAPAFWDIQLNGRWGISFSDPTLTVEQVAEIVRAQAALGAARICPTLITASRETLRHGVQTIAAACDESPDVGLCVAGLHLEGPYLSEIDGYRGAHPKEQVRDPDWSEFQALQDAARGRIVLITLAPERPGALEFIRRATLSGVVVAIGHTAADGATLRAATAEGARLSTHLGNGISATLPRHPNPIWEQAALDYLSASLIADGHHLDRATLRVLVRAKTPERIILVSDASPLAGLPPGEYGGWEVAASGKIVVAGTPYLAGSNQGLDVGLANLLGAGVVTLSQALATVTRHPARLLGRPAPVLQAGEPANLVGFTCPRRGPGPQPGFSLRWACVDGRWVDARDDGPPRNMVPGRP